MASTSSKFTAAYVALAAAAIWLTGGSPRRRKARWLTKPLLMPTLAASLATNPAARRSPLRVSTLTAQAGGWGGDVALLAGGTKPFLLGTTSFGLGHLAYISGFRRLRVTENPRNLLSTPSGKLGLGLWLLAAPGLGLAARRQEPTLGPAVASYAALIATMIAHAGNLSPAQPRTARILTITGAAIFGASDTMLGARKFVVQQPSPVLNRTVMATYTLGQFLLSQGAARAIRCTV